MEVDLPPHGNYLSVCGARIQEIKAIEKQLEHCEHGLRAFQKLPRNMQRRAVSNNPQRLPRYLREKHKREVGNNIKAGKRPCRRFRRRASNLLSEYSRRQRNAIWLETHVWHAKRFHMKTKWGYSIPMSPTSKSFRSSLRAATESCLVQDVSYECCSEIEGSFLELHKGFSTMMTPDELNGLCHSRALKGLEWISATLYTPNRYPHGALGDAQILWVSHSAHEPSCRLWIWVHPSMHEDVLTSFVQIFGLKKEEKQDNGNLVISCWHVSNAKLASKNVPFVRTPKYTSPTVKLIVLKDTLIKFRLTGPRSFSLLEKILQPSEVDQNEQQEAKVSQTNNQTDKSIETKPNQSDRFSKLKPDQNESVKPETSQTDILPKTKNNQSDKFSKPKHDQIGSVKQETNQPGKLTQPNTQSSEKGSWWVSLYSDPVKVRALDNQLALWASSKDAQNESRKVLGFIIRDPRVILPRKKLAFQEDPDPEQILNRSETDPEQKVGQEEEIEQNKKQKQQIECEDYKDCFDTTFHPIFDSAVRDDVTYTMKPNSAINDLRATKLVPGMALPITPDESRVPVLLMARTATHVSGLGSGWDLVMPCGWGSQTLVCLAMHGAAVGGEEQTHCLTREFLQPPATTEVPDTTAGREHSRLQQKEREEEYFRKPPNCRNNFIKLGVSYPFGVNWLEIVKGWEPSCEEVYVLRERKFLQWLAAKTCKKYVKLEQEKQSGNAPEKDSGRKSAQDDSGERKKSGNPDETLKKMMHDRLCSTSGSSSLSPQSGIPTEKSGISSEESVTLTERSDVPAEKSGISNEEVSACLEDTVLMEGLNKHRTALLYVRISLLGKGSLEPLAVICQPTVEDLAAFSLAVECALVEPTHQDHNVTKRTLLKGKHKQELNHLRRKRKRARSELLSGEENPLQKHKTMKEALQAAVDTVNVEKKEIVSSITSYNETLQKLWLLNPSETQPNLRQTFGILTNAGFCNRMGRSGGVGYVVASPLIDSLQDANRRVATGLKSQTLVLVRNTASFSYRWARLIVLN